MNFEDEQRAPFENESIEEQSFTLEIAYSLTLEITHSPLPQCCQYATADQNSRKRSNEASQQAGSVVGAFRPSG